MADHFGLLVDFLGHEVAVVGLVDQRRRGGVLDRVAMNDRVVFVVDGRAFARQHDPIAILEITDRIGERAECDGIRAQIHLAFTVTDRERRPVARTDHQIVVAGEDEGERKRAAKLRQRRLDRLDRCETAAEQIIDELQHDLGVGLGLEHCLLFLQGFAQFVEILDDAVVNDGDAGGGVRVRVVLGRLAVSGPAGVADAGVTFERLGAQTRFEIFQFAFGATTIEMAAFDGRDACGIVAAIFQALQRIDQLLRDGPAPQNADNAAHADQYPQIVLERSSKPRDSLNENPCPEGTQ